MAEHDAPITRADETVIRPDWVPAENYRDRDLDALEAQNLWPRVWQMACRESDLPAVGSYVRYDILDDSILVARIGPRPHDVVAYYNVCQHRGRELKEAPRGMLGASIACRFHGWQWEIDGTPRTIHREDDWQGCPEFTKSNLALPRVLVGFWGGWVWINQDPDAEPLLDYLGIIPEVLDPFEPENMRPVYWKTLIAPVHWKIVAEAFNEGYHSWATHHSGVNYKHLAQPSVAHGKHAMFYADPPPAFGEYKDENGKWKLPKTAQESMWANSQHLFRTLGALTLAPGMAAAERLRALPEDTPPETIYPLLFDFHREELERRGVTYPQGLTMEAVGRAGLDWHIFPNSIVLPSVDGALWYRIRPNGRVPDSCIFDIWSFGRFAPGQEPEIVNEVSHGFEEFKGQCEFLEEDFENMAAVQRGVRSRGFRGARTNPYQEVSITNFQKQLAIWRNGGG